MPFAALRNIFNGDNKSQDWFSGNRINSTTTSSAAVSNDMCFDEKNRKS